MKRLITLFSVLLLVFVFSASVVFSFEFFTTVDYPDAVETETLDINNRGEIVGCYQDSSGYWHGFLYYNDTFSSIDYPDVENTVLPDINDRGEIVDSYFISLGGDYHSFLYYEGTFTSIDYPDVEDIAAMGVNNLGQIVGVYEDSTAHLHGFIAK